MRSKRMHGLDLDRAEQLLSGAVAPPGEDPLADVLAAAAAPATAEELAGEQAAMRAFARSRLHPVARTSLASRLARILAWKFAGVVLAGAVAGGTALAIGGIVLDPFDGPAREAPPAVPATPTTSPASPDPRSDATPGGEPPGSTSPQHPAATPSPSPPLTTPTPPPVTPLPEPTVDPPELPVEPPYPPPGGQ